MFLELAGLVRLFSIIFQFLAKVTDEILNIVVVDKGDLRIISNLF